MDFEKNRREVLQQLSKMRQSKKGTKKAFTKKPGQKVSFSGDQVTISQKEKKEIILFAKQSVFIRNLLQTLSSSYSVVHLDNPEKACDHCLDHNCTAVLLDMDEPTDWKMSHDVFTTIRTINTDITFILLTKNSRVVPVKTLSAHGAAVVLKPVNFEELKSYIK